MSKRRRGKNKKHHKPKAKQKQKVSEKTDTDILVAKTTEEDQRSNSDKESGSSDKKTSETSVSKDLKPDPKNDKKDQKTDADVKTTYKKFFPSKKKNKDSEKKSSVKLQEKKTPSEKEVKKETKEKKIIESQIKETKNEAKNKPVMNFKISKIFSWVKIPTNFNKIKNSITNDEARSRINKYLNDIIGDIKKRSKEKSSGLTKVEKQYQFQGLARVEEKSLMKKLRGSYHLKEKETKDQHKIHKRIKRQKRVMSRLFVVFIGVLILFLSSVLFVISWFEEGSEKIEARDYQISEFQSVDIDWRGNLLLEQGETQKLTIEAEDNILEWLDVKVENDTLLITKKMWIPIFKISKLLRNTSPINIKITTPDISKVTLSGYAELEIERLQSDSLELSLAQNSEAEARGLNLENLTIEMSGFSDLKVLGKTVNQTVAINDQALYNARSLKTDNCEIKTHGESEAKLNIVSILTANALDSSKVFYAGEPEVEEKEEAQGIVAKFGEDLGE